MHESPLFAYGTQMLASNSRQLKHSDLVFAEYWLEFGVGIDGAFIRGILQAIGFDVVPDLFNHFSARYGFCPDHRCEFVAW